MKATQYNDTIEQAENYIRSDRSDPFTRNRVYSHLSTALCDDAIVKSELRDCRYKAEPYQETRHLPPSPLHPKGQKYTVTVYRNASRP